MDSVLELQRQTHEEIEHFERALYDLLARVPASHQASIQNQHKASQALERISSRISSLSSQYEDTTARQAEIDLLSPKNNQDDLSEFYSRLKKIHDHHHKYPDAVPLGFDLELSALLDEPLEGDEEYEEEDPISLLFSGEEAYGKYLDLYTNHTEYSNLKNIGKRPGYLQYLDLLLSAVSNPIHEELPKETRFSRDYETYIKNLHSYLRSFAKRAQPLEDIEGQQADAEADFNTKWEAGTLKGWDEPSADKSKTNGESGGIWCSACQRSYAKQTVYDAHLTSKKHTKATAKQATSEAPPQNPNGDSNHQAQQQSNSSQSALRSRVRNAALLTHLSTSLIASLVSTLNETKSNVERRFSLTAREREQELLDQNKPTAPPPQNVDGTAEEEEEEERIYNPLKLPLGWDGKPIPYWLYKLHGLGVEYRCEICSDHVYMGRKNFDRHFQESRHAFGMRALGLPNTKHFHEITGIDDALALAEKLKKEGRHEIFEQETMEELEDDEGNVYNRKTYEDLKKQGII